jgi:L,D-transpeptidase catalytic domain
MSRTAILAALGVLFAFGSANADVVIRVNKTTQRLDVNLDGKPLYEWPVSTARWGYETPNGTYHPERLEKTWYSRKYDMSPMPHSIFFDGGYAIHGSYEISHLGRPASHGCIRLSPSHAATLYALVEAHRSNTRIVVTGSRPSGPALARAERREVVRDTQPGYVQPGFQNIYNWSPPAQDNWYDRNSGGWWGN